MATSSWLIIIAVLLFIVSGLYFIYKSARKFKLNKEQLERIKQRNAELDRQEELDR